MPQKGWFEMQSDSEAVYIDSIYNNNDIYIYIYT